MLAVMVFALLVAENELRLPLHVSRFVLTIGSTANQNGTALFEGVTVLFLAQLDGVDLALGEQFAVVGVCVLGVDRFFDMCGTTVNVTGDLGAAVVVAHGEDAHPNPEPG